ncbi:hypothetical protein IWQ62_005616 [Dispira parvispora]|uniref:Uncharacterized protein n=1 Tax=Dispira parvispora TaxID=1520584 RepID=A0A9W8AJM9_9FUNG|nr:hypothetical protein IWQ62_005616 [Dispira parvispora]
MKVYHASLTIAFFAFVTATSVVGGPQEGGGDFFDGGDYGGSHHKDHRHHFDNADSFTDLRSQNYRHSHEPRKGWVINTDKFFVESYREAILDVGDNDHLLKYRKMDRMSLLFNEEMKSYKDGHNPHKLLNRGEGNFEPEYLKQVFHDQLIILAYVSEAKELAKKSLQHIDKLTNQWSLGAILSKSSNKKEMEKLRRVVVTQVTTLAALAAQRFDFDLLSSLMKIMSDFKKGFVDDAKFAVTAIIAQFIEPDNYQHIEGFQGIWKKMVNKVAKQKRPHKDMPDFMHCLQWFGMEKASEVIYGKGERKSAEPTPGSIDKCTKYFFYGVEKPDGDIAHEDFVLGYAPPRTEATNNP